MWTFIVTWCIVYSVQCDRTITDEFGRIRYNNDFRFCVTYQNDCNHSKTFLDRTEAFAFYGRALDEVQNTNSFLASHFLKDGSLTDVEIDSVFKNDVGIVDDSLNKN